MGNTLKFENLWKLCFIMSIAAFMFISAPTMSASAATTTTTTTVDQNAITNTLCNVVNTLTGGVGKSISIIIVISLAFGLFLGKVSWGMAIGVAAAMGALFGSKDLVTLIGGGAAMCS